MCYRKVVSGRKVQVLLGPWLMLGIWSLNVPVLMCGSEAMIWKEKGRSRIRGIQIRELCEVM